MTGHNVNMIPLRQSYSPYYDLTDFLLNPVNVLKILLPVDDYAIQFVWIGDLCIKISPQTDRP